MIRVNTWFAVWAISLFSIPQVQVLAQIIEPSPSMHLLGKLQNDHIDAQSTKNKIAEYNTMVIENAPKVVEQSKKAFGNDYAGTWIGYDDFKRARQYIAVRKGTNLSKIKSIMLENSISVVQVMYSHAELEGFANRISTLFRGVTDEGEPLVLSLGVDEKANRVIISGKKSNLLRIESILQESDIDKNVVKFEAQESKLNLGNIIYGRTKPSEYENKFIFNIAPK